MYKMLLRSCKLVMITSVFFVILTGLAMVAYPGGSKYDRTSLHYNIFLNFFSDLGTTITYSGKQNTLSNILFIIALGSTGLVMIYFSKIWRAIDTTSHEHKILGFLSKIFLVISGSSFIGLAFTPWNKFFDFHLIFFKLAFSFLLAWTLIIIFLQFSNRKMRGLVIVNIIFVLSLSGYDYFLFTGPNFGAEEGFEFQAITQKIIVYLTIINLFIQAFGIKRFLRSADFRRNGMRNFYV